MSKNANMRNSETKPPEFLAPYSPSLTMSLSSSNLDLSYNEKTIPTHTITAQELYDKGYYYYKLAIEIKNNNKGQEKIDNNGMLAAESFWKSLCLGHPQAAYSLYKCFTESLGVKENIFVTNILFGVALKLGDPKCSEEGKTTHNNIMNTGFIFIQVRQIDYIIKNDIQRHLNVNTQVDISVVQQKMDVLNETIILPYGGKIMGLIIHDPISNTLPYDDLTLAGHDYIDTEKEFCCIL